MMDWDENTGSLAFRAESGDHSAQYRLGVLFLLGRSVEQDLEAALRWLKLAGDYGNAHLLVEKLTRYTTATPPVRRTTCREVLSGVLSEVSRLVAERAVAPGRGIYNSSKALLRAFSRLRRWGQLMRTRFGAGMKAAVRDENRGTDGLSETI